MPSGRTHDRITLWSLPVVAGATFERTRSSQLTLLVSAGYLFGGLMLGPDLDIYSVHYKRWGWLRWIWIPYRGSLKHRSLLSHGPILGTMLRVVYLGGWVGMLSLLGLAVFNQLVQTGWTWDQIFQVLGRSLRMHWASWLAVGVGLELGAFSHYVSDWGVSTYKRVKRSGWQAAFPAAFSRKKKRFSSRSASKSARSLRKSSSAKSSGSVVTPPPTRKSPQLPPLPPPGSDEFSR